jgi:hypothetical protein
MTDFNSFNPNNPLSGGFGLPQNKKKIDPLPMELNGVPAGTPAQNASLSPDEVLNFYAQQAQGVGNTLKAEQMMSHFDSTYQKAAQQISDVYQQEFGKPVPDKLLPLMVDRYLNNNSQVVIQA